ncbi:CYCLIN-DEPENDENT KINASE INHIBITOR 7 [Salix purpurea]|uniref:CYCLIN-DEPENDENT KINASE INHIBITOR 7 n=1 Tax=Salix purpurea TaxID=77065 RepID=A0A9Q0V199_SALPP|nr:CYCLIN-DEPENDENT KINASE INHIBITOR 7 [Salix purpurea]
MVRHSRAIEKVAMGKVAAAQVGVRTRARARKQRSSHIKISIKVRSDVTDSRQERLIIRPDNIVSYPPDVSSGHREVTKERCSSPSSDDDSDDNHSVMSSSSCCSSNGSFDEIIKFTDLEEERVEVETSLYYSSTRREREKTPTNSSALGEESTSENMDSTATPVPLKKPNSRQRSTAATVIRITDEEVEKFFCEIEKTVPQRFKDKYNFDFDKDEALEGRYEWVRLNP